MSEYQNYLNEDGEISEELIREELEPTVRRDWENELYEQVEQETDDEDVRESGLTRQEFIENEFEDRMQVYEDEFEEELDSAVEHRLTELEDEMAEEVDPW